MTIQPRDWKLIRMETIKCVFVNALLPTAGMWFANAPPPSTLLGAQGLLLVMAETCCGAAGLVTLILTYVIRHHVRKNNVKSLEYAHLNQVIRLLPGAAGWRAILLVIFAMLVFIPAFALIIAAMHVLPFTKIGLALFNMIFGAVLGIIITPIIVIRALADTPPAAPNLKSHGLGGKTI